MYLINPYCTIADVQAETANSKVDNVPAFTDAINQASRFIDDTCQRDFLLHDHSMTPFVIPRAWYAGENIFMPWPIIGLTKIEVTYDRVNWTELPASEWSAEISSSPTSRIVRFGEWSASFDFRQATRIYGTFGYPKAPIPPGRTSANFFQDRVPSDKLPQDIRMACTVIASVRSGQYKKDVIQPDGTTRNVSIRAIPDDILKILEKYKVKFL